jgi:hypothetical protein
MHESGVLLALEKAPPGTGDDATKVTDSRRRAVATMIDKLMVQFFDDINRTFSSAIAVNSMNNEPIE